MTERSGVRRRKGSGPGPWLVIAAIALIPVVMLAVVYTWSSGQHSDNEAAPTTDPAVEVPPAAPALSTSLFTLRRMPTLVSRELNISAFGGPVSSFLGTLNDRSCGAVSVDGELVGERNANIPVIPASTQKLLVAATALERLGADFTYTTDVVAAQPPTDGVVSGDLYLVGGGDPLLSSDWYPTSNLERHPVTTPTSLDALADRVAAAGISQVTGSIVGDASRYDDEFYAPGWGEGVAGIESGPYDALMANDSRVEGDAYRSNDPNEAAAREFTRLLQARGVSIASGATTGVAPASATQVASIESAPMSDVVTEMLLASDNNTAELVVKELGFSEAGAGAREAGLGVIREQLVAWGVDVAPIVLADGSGLAPGNRLTCAAVVTVLQQTGFQSSIGQGMPVAGQTGTLSDTFVDHAVAGRLRGKTGTLNNPPFNVDPPAVKAISGYLPVEGGGQVEYTLILNGPTVSDQSEYRPVWSALADALDTYPAGASPADVGPR